jgi:hypothetical protein
MTRIHKIIICSIVLGIVIVSGIILLIYGRNTLHRLDFNTITQEAILTKNVSLCDNILAPFASLGGTDQDNIIAGCYRDYVRVHHDQNVCLRIPNDRLCPLTLTLITGDASVCGEDAYCVAAAASLHKNDITICDILKVGLDRQKCKGYISKGSFRSR